MTRETSTPADTASGASTWTFLSNHAHVLICVTQDPEARLRDIAERVGITERACISIVSDLEMSGYLERERIGRRNSYKVFLDRPLRHPVEAPHTVGELVAAVAAPSASADAGRHIRAAT